DLGEPGSREQTFDHLGCLVPEGMVEVGANLRLVSPQTDLIWQDASHCAAKERFIAPELRQMVGWCRQDQLHEPAVDEWMAHLDSKGRGIAFLPVDRLLEWRKAQMTADLPPRHSTSRKKSPLRQTMVEPGACAQIASDPLRNPWREGASEETAHPCVERLGKKRTDQEAVDLFPGGLAPYLGITLDLGDDARVTSEKALGGGEEAALEKIVSSQSCENHARSPARQEPHPLLQTGKPAQERALQAHRPCALSEQPVVLRLDEEAFEARTLGQNSNVSSLIALLELIKDERVGEQGRASGCLQMALCDGGDRR